MKSKIIGICGPSGGGKSTVATALSESLGAPVIHLDQYFKKELEGKPKRVAKIAGVNKFLRIYYARVMEVYC